MSKKIMFNDKYGLTTAVLDGRKTMTRRVMNIQPPNEGCHISFLIDSTDGKDEKYAGRAAWIYEGCQITDFLNHYTVGEVIAIAQSYEQCGYGGESLELMSSAGWTNKMFVKPELMPHHIKITEIKTERLQDISDEDCIKEGVIKLSIGCFVHGIMLKNQAHIEKEYRELQTFKTPREAFSVLIDKVSGKGTWESNPFVWIYKFELVD